MRISMLGCVSVVQKAVSKLRAHEIAKTKHVSMSIFISYNWSSCRVFILVNTNESNNNIYLINCNIV